MIDKGTADKEHLGVGDSVRVSARTPARAFKIVGVARYGTVNSLGGATIAVFTVPVARELLDKQGFDTIYVAARSGVSPRQLVAQLKPIVGAQGGRAHRRAEGLRGRRRHRGGDRVHPYFLLAFGGDRARRRRLRDRQHARDHGQPAHARAGDAAQLGASRKQVRRSVVLEALATGVIASLVGLFGGLALAKGLSAVFKAMEIDLPQSTYSLAPRTIIVSLVLGIGVTLLASLAPARRAMRIARSPRCRTPARRFAEPTARRQLVARVAARAGGRAARRGRVRRDGDRAGDGADRRRLPAAVHVRRAAGRPRGAPDRRGRRRAGEALRRAPGASRARTRRATRAAPPRPPRR